MPRRVARRTGAPRHPLRKSRTSSWQSPESQWCVTLLEAGLPRFVEHELSRRSATLPYSCSTVVQPEDFCLLKKETSSLRPGLSVSLELPAAELNLVADQGAVKAVVIVLVRRIRFRSRFPRSLAGLRQQFRDSLFGLLG